MISLPSIPQYNIGKDFTISGSGAYAYAEIALRNPASGEFVAFTTADASGNYTFNLDNNLPLEVVLSAQEDATQLSTLSVPSAAVPTDQYRGGSVVMIQNPFAGSIYWLGAPSISIVTTLGGSGFSGHAVLASAGQTFKWYDGVAEFDGQIPLGAAPIRHIVVDNPGEGYTGSFYPYTYLRVSGTRIIGPGPAGDFEYPPESGSWFSYYPDDGGYNGVTYIRALNEPSWFNGVYANLDQASASGAYDNPGANQGWISNLPNKQDVTQPVWDGTPNGTNALNQLRSAVDLFSFYNGKYALAYYSIIYGQDPNNINITGFPPIPGSSGFVLSGSAVDAYNRGLISKQELDILKGYFGKELLVGGVLNIVGNQLTNQIVASILLLGYNIAQGVTQTSILQEMRSVWRQGKGVLETDMSGRVRTILTKMQAATGNNYIDNLQVRDANNVIHQWNFTGSAPTSTAL